MADDGTTVGVRMYNVGFGDAFRISVQRGEARWTMLVDCGVHSAGQSRNVEESVEQIVADLRADSTDGRAHLNVVVATHHHRDHTSGFAESQWEEVTVDEVWLPFVEDEDDPDTVRLSGTLPLAATAQRLQKLIGSQTQLTTNPTLSLAQNLAENCSINEKAMDRLLGRNGKKFGSEPHRRFLPYLEPEKNTISIDSRGITAHILGPCRDEAMLKKMRPPKRAGWFTLDDAAFLEADDGPKVEAPFSPTYVLPEDAFDDAPPALQALHNARKSPWLREFGNSVTGLLGAAAILERAVNNTSLFFVLDIYGLTMLFPGDAQYGAWEHVRNNPAAKNLIDNVDFYKVSHHGSHNATPGQFARNDWAKYGDAMVPWGEVTIWEDKIPWEPLLDDLSKQGQRQIVLPAEVREAEPSDGHPTPTYDGDGRWWTELTYHVPAVR